MDNKAESKVASFYRGTGWQFHEGVSEDARRWEDLRKHAQKYVSQCRLRLLRHIPSPGHAMLDMASGPIQYEEYLEYSKYYKKRYCVDLSDVALNEAQLKIGDHGVFLCGSLFDINLRPNFFDCTISLHTIYHIDKGLQEDAINRLIEATKPGAPIIVIYSNPNTLIGFIRSSIFYRGIMKILRLCFSRSPSVVAGSNDIYFFAHPNSWWNRFSRSCDVTIFPWRSFSSEDQKLLFPNNRFGALCLDLLFRLEDMFPQFFVAFFQYPMIILQKKSS